MLQKKREKEEKKTNFYNWNIQNFKVRDLIISKTSVILNLPDEKICHILNIFFLLQSNIAQTHLGCYHFKSYILHQMLVTYDKVLH